MGKYWTEEAIACEIRKLDNITGLNGAERPIVFSNLGKKTLGLFWEIGKGIFQFSKSYFQGRGSLSYMIGLDVIKHEYAHYMVSCLYDWKSIGDSHGIEWQNCCEKIGARPEAVKDLDEWEKYVYENCNGGLVECDPVKRFTNTTPSGIEYWKKYVKS